MVGAPEFEISQCLKQKIQIQDPCYLLVPKRQMQILTVDISITFVPDYDTPNMWARVG